jgi:hypothetical protein
MVSDVAGFRAEMTFHLYGCLPPLSCGKMVAQAFWKSRNTFSSRSLWVFRWLYWGHVTLFRQAGGLKKVSHVDGKIIVALLP